MPQPTIGLALPRRGADVRYPSVAPQASIDREILGLGDLADLNAQVRHQNRILEKAKLDVATYVRENWTTIVADLVEPAAELVDSINAEIAAVGARLTNEYVPPQQRVSTLVALSGGNVRTVPSVDHAAALARHLRDQSLAVPMPAEES